MNLLMVIHGYPTRYNAGSEVYTQTLCSELASHHNVHVFTRNEDPFAPDFSMSSEVDAGDPRITLHVVNNPRMRDRYRVSEIDDHFSQILDRVQPNIVHVGHLNHLSTSLLYEVARRKIPIVYTLHDYWLMCPRGQFMQMFPADQADLWASCSGQEDRKCAERCYARYFGGGAEEEESDVGYWSRWVGSRMRHVRDIAGLVDVFIAPSRYLLARYRDDFGVAEGKIVFLDYGFDHARLKFARRRAMRPITFGYIGTHIPAKGIQDLIRAFGLLRGDARLRIWGKARGQETEALQNIARQLPADAASRVEWLGEYENKDMAHRVLAHCDVIVVPSIWVENSPLVVHEAQQGRLAVIAANAGGMAEYVRHEVNGLLFDYRSHESLALQMQRLVDSPELARSLGEKGYLYSPTGDVPDI